MLVAFPVVHCLYHNFKQSDESGLGFCASFNVMVASRVENLTVVVMTADLATTVVADVLMILTIVLMAKLVLLHSRL